MNVDILLYIFFIIPLFIVGFQLEKLNEKKGFILWISIASFLIIIGILIENNSNNEMRYLSYFGSQMLFIFLILQTITRNIYFKIFNREPEFGKFPNTKLITFILCLY
jgi:cellobiose-specific phosphotransferase system component IIC